MISAKAFDANGVGSYADVIRALDRAVEYKDQFNIRVLNLSFSAVPQSHYWDDPLEPGGHGRPGRPASSWWRQPVTGVQTR